MQVFLETERLVLRRFTGNDVQNLFDLDNDPEVMRFITGGRPTPRAVVRNETLPRFLCYYERYARFGFWAAVEKRSNRFLGWFELRPPDSGGPGEVELGYRLRREAWGRGYATEGSQALIRRAFAELEVVSREDTVGLIQLAGARAARWERQVAALGIPFSQLLTRLMLTAAAVPNCCRWVLFCPR